MGEHNGLFCVGCRKCFPNQEKYQQHLPKERPIPFFSPLEGDEIMLETCRYSSLPCELCRFDKTCLIKNAVGRWDGV